MTVKVRQWPVWLVVDVVLIVIFAILGRREHEHALSAPGIVQTAAPFVVAYLIMVLISRPWFTINRIWPTGLLIWFGTVAVGLALRIGFGATAAVPFIIVAAIVLGLFLVGRRLVTGLIARRSAHQQ
ncbi:DUF3054 domain-containing protein [Glutamicibacter sp. MNS18]|uniref:DUF3054 domain-containing protein n=1 Tax=Glutamicibacter sp. MNS18 TaxID=2989817 RepID=UPI002236AB24|nr:DUF3054 domain-containing protein [Glutamicibacter sp. MNS18]MCW4464874.1 DUF3054 domain-containing protein [Glutamicibacter sp. MNS18]